MNILSVETSCDETGIALLSRSEDKIKVLSHRLASQAELHEKYGGVYPTLAVREHKRNLTPLLNEVLKETDKEGVDRLAVTVGPGLEPCLWAGIEFVKTLAVAWDTPVIPVDHIEAHILVVLLNRELEKVLPSLALIASGGHTQLILVEKIGRYEIVGETRDDAAGECFDKTARLLGLPYPGGPAIAEKAERWRTEQGLKIELPRPMLDSDDYDFSFSGLKTAVLYDHRKRRDEVKQSEQYIQSMAHAIQEAIVDVLVEKTTRAADDLDVKSVILGGGVSANTRLRDDLEEGLSTSLLTVPPALATDNGVMIGAAAFFHKDETEHWSNLKADANLRVDKT